MIRGLSNKIFGYDLTKEMNNQGVTCKIVEKEADLIEWVLSKMDSIDSDMIIGIDLYSNVMETIMNRSREVGVANLNRLGRINRIRREDYNKDKKD